MLNVSYLVSCSNEGSSVVHLFNRILNTGIRTDELVILQDDKFSQANDNLTYVAIHNAFEKLPPNISVNYLRHPLNNDYGSHKNYGIEHCKGDYIFQLDGDEMPPDALLGENLHALLEENPNVEAYAVARINDFRGVTEDHAKHWGWRLTESPTYKRPIVNFPDYQWRIFKRDYPRISFTRKLHEKIEGYDAYSVLPPEEEWSIYHDKTIEKQLETNARYNKDFSDDENRGHNVFGK